MDIKSNIVSQYSIAFIEALDKSEAKGIFDNVHELYHSIKDNHEYLSLLSSTSVEINVKKKLVDDLFAKDKTPYLRNMLYYMLDKDDQKYLLDILREIIHKLSSELDYVILKITSAYELSNKDVDAIVKKVGDKLKKKVIPEVFIDASYIAGISIEYDSMRVDNSIKAKLNEIKQNLLV